MIRETACSIKLISVENEISDSRYNKIHTLMPYYNNVCLWVVWSPVRWSVLRKISQKLIKELRQKSEFSK